MRLAASLAVFVLAVSPSVAGSSLHHTLTVKQHVVRGATAAEVYRALLHDPIMDADSGRSFANLTHEHEIDIVTTMSGGQCRVTDLEFQWDFVMTLPAARDEAQLSSATRKTWRSFIARLRTHELNHRDIFLDCGRTLMPKASALTASSCSKLERDVRRYLEMQYDACMVRQRAFDADDTPGILAHPFIRLAKQ